MSVTEPKNLPNVSQSPKIYSLLQLEPKFWGFLCKIPCFIGVENYLNAMQNSPIFSQMLILMWKVSQKVLVPKFSVVLELQSFKIESTKNISFTRKKEYKNVETKTHG